MEKSIEEKTIDKRIAEFEKYNPIAKSIVDIIETINKMNDIKPIEKKEKLLLKYTTVKKILDINF